MPSLTPRSTHPSVSDESEFLLPPVTAHLRPRIPRHYPSPVLRPRRGVTAPSSPGPCARLPPMRTRSVRAELCDRSQLLAGAAPRKCVANYETRHAIRIRVSFAVPSARSVRADTQTRTQKHASLASGFRRLCRGCAIRSGLDSKCVSYVIAGCAPCRDSSSNEFARIQLQPDCTIVGYPDPVIVQRILRTNTRHA